MIPPTSSPPTSPPAVDGAPSAETTDPRRRPLPLVPRLARQGYARELVDRRRAWVEEQCQSDLEHVGRYSIESEDWRGNVENPIGAAQMPIGLAGPLVVHGEHTHGELLYVPLATTEGALVRSYERGMVTIARSGGAQARVELDRNRITPVFPFDDVAAASEFARRVPGHFEALHAAVAETTRHGRLERVDCLLTGREVQVDFQYSTGDAQGMNMCSTATDAACRWLVAHTEAERYLIFSGYNSEKRASGSLLRGGKGKSVVAGVRVEEGVCRAVLHATPRDLVRLWHHTVVGHLRTGALGYNGHVANGLTALFVATGQDVANVANSSVGITHFELCENGDLYASVTLPSLSVATVGGGTGLGTSRECLELLGCAGSGRARRLAEITAATALAGELSMGAAIVSGEFVGAHETLGRNRPTAEAAP